MSEATVDITTNVPEGARFEKIFASEVSEGIWVVYTTDNIYCGYVKGDKERAEAYTRAKKLLGKFTWIRAIDIVNVSATRPEIDLSNIEGYVG